MTFRTEAFEQHLAAIRARNARRIVAMGDVSQGAVLRQASAERWAFLLPDMTEPGKWRLQYFDARGFSGHAIFESQDALVQAALGGGFHTRDDTALDRLQELPSFQRGNFASGLIQKVNARAMTFAEADIALSQYDSTHLISQ